MAPTVVAEFAKSKLETVRATLQDYAGRRVLDLRSFMPKRDGTLVPTRRGLTIGIDALPELEEAVKAARAAVGTG